MFEVRSTVVSQWAQSDRRPSPGGPCNAFWGSNAAREQAPGPPAEQLKKQQARFCRQRRRRSRSTHVVVLAWFGQACHARSNGGLRAASWRAGCRLHACHWAAAAPACLRHRYCRKPGCICAVPFAPPQPKLRSWQCMPPVKRTQVQGAVQGHALPRPPPAARCASGCRCSQTAHVPCLNRSQGASPANSYHECSPTSTRRSELYTLAMHTQGPSMWWPQHAGAHATGDREESPPLDLSARGTPLRLVLSHPHTPQAHPLSCTCQALQVLQRHHGRNFAAGHGSEAP